MNNKNTLSAEFLKELEAETNASRKCLERIPESLFNWKPHEKSMTLGYLSLLVAEIPKWIKQTVETGEIDFAKWEHFQPKTTAELVDHLDMNLKGAKNALQNTTDEKLSELFYLKNNGQVLMSSSKKESVGQSINHLVHHRGQLTVYMRLNNIPVPSIYGPSADEKMF
ncbi:MAG: DinB family protein [Candidatus Kryptoniota bacterium]